MTPTFWTQPNEDEQNPPEEMPPVCGECGETHEAGGCAEFETTAQDRAAIREYESRQARRRGETGFDTLEEYRGEK